MFFNKDSFNNMAFQEVLALWATSERNVGGIEFDEFQLGLSHMFSGISMLIYQGLLYHRLDKFFGSLFLNRVVTLFKNNFKELFFFFFVYKYRSHYFSFPTCSFFLTSTNSLKTKHFCGFSCCY